MTIHKATFSEFFETATGNCPFPFQESFAIANPLPSLVDLPTGLGKTALVLLGWCWRRRFAGGSLRDSTPRRLVYCLPMRVLVEQTRDNAIWWLDRLDLLGGLAEFDHKGRVTSYQPSFADPAKITVHVLMGGEDGGDWDLYPERDMILIGTQDMLLSRALNRGYAASRARWPMQFGLLHTDSLWVYDEIQLMGSGLATTTQLDALRYLLPDPHDRNAADGHGCRSVWMSATLEPSWLETVDFKQRMGSLPAALALGDEDLRHPEVAKRRNATKPLTRTDAGMGDTEALAATIVDAHAEWRGLTLVVVNTVQRSRELHVALRIALGKGDAPRLVLLHSRFRPPDRQSRIAQLLDAPPDSGTICVSTQVVEAGVDVDATTLFTELAPWASLVQRFGRCNRRGDRNDSARVFWAGLPDQTTFERLHTKMVTGRDGTLKAHKQRNQAFQDHLQALARPYRLDELQASASRLESLKDVGIGSLPAGGLPFEHTHVLRRRDLVDLFDTTPDLAGNDIDIDRYVRDIEDTDVRVFWRQWESAKASEPPGDASWRRVGRDELCPVPIGQFKDFARAKPRRGLAWRWDFSEGEWEAVRDKAAIYPGQTYLVHASAGGYDPEAGWIGADGKPDVEPLGAIEPEALSDDAYDDDGLSKTDSWQTIAQHTDDVCQQLEEVLDALPLSEDERAALRAAGRWHDWGKVHPSFQIKIDDGQELVKPGKDGHEDRNERPSQWRGCREVAKAPDDRKDRLGNLVKRGYWTRVSKEDGGRRHFRHELASALGVLRPDVHHPTLAGTDRDLVAYLIAAHHGKVRLSIRSMPRELRPRHESGARIAGCRFARGVWDGDELAGVDLGDRVVAPPVTLSLEPMEIGLCEHAPFEDEPSWLERALRLRDTLGPFRLAYLEAMLRAADCRASAAATGAEAPLSPEEVARV